MDSRGYGRKGAACSRVVLGMGELQPTHLLLLAFVALVLFGGPRLAQAGKGLGEGIRNFRKALRDDAPPGGHE
jgi:sec-independent protein translocase protein TatA